MTLSNANFEEIENLLQKATSEPWVTDLKNHTWIVSCGELNNYHTIATINSKVGMNGQNNAKFIATSRQIVIKLIDEIKRLKKIIEKLKNKPFEGECN